MKYIDDHGIERDWEKDKDMRTPQGDLDEAPEVEGYVTIDVIVDGALCETALYEVGQEEECEAFKADVMDGTKWSPLATEMHSQYHGHPIISKGDAPCICSQYNDGDHTVWMNEFAKATESGDMADLAQFGLDMIAQMEAEDSQVLTAEKPKEPIPNAFIRAWRNFLRG